LPDSSPAFEMSSVARVMATERNKDGSARCRPGQILINNSTYRNLTSEVRHDTAINTPSAKSEDELGWISEHTFDLVRRHEAVRTELGRFREIIRVMCHPPS